MERFELDNGITVLHYPQAGESIVMNVLVTVGSDHESEKHGIAHFVEHMLFEGTTQRSREDISGTIEGLGGEISAYTANDATCVALKMLRRHFEKGCEIVSDIVMNPMFPKEAMEKERSVILSEVLMRRDEPRSYQWDMMQNVLFEGTSAAHPVIGDEESVKSISQEDIKTFHASCFTGANMIIVVVGEYDDIGSVMSTYFGALPKGRKIAAPSVNSELTGRRCSEADRGLEQHYLLLGYPARPLTYPVFAVFEVIRSILGRGLSGRLFRILRDQYGLSYDVGAYYVSSVSYGIFVLNAVAPASQIPKCEQLLLQELKGVADISSEELQQAKNFLEGECIFDKEDKEQVAELLAMYEHLGVPAYFDRYVELIRDVSREDIRAVITDYFEKPYARILVK